jgi:opine dehydrogenase
VDSIAITSFSNVGMILHCAPVLMNIGWIESDKVDFKYYYDGISKSIAHFLEKMDYERLEIASLLGFSIESVREWLCKTYNSFGSDLYSCLRTTEAYREIDAPPTIHTRYLLEDVPNGLVPLEYLASNLSIKTPSISTIIDLASSVLDIDFRKNGRRFSLECLKNYI